MRNKDYFKVGSIYNKEYFGDNEAYKFQNGQTTFQITKIHNDSVVYDELFTQFPNALSEHLTGGGITWSISRMVASQNEFRYTEVFDKKDFFIHSQRMTIDNALKSGLVKIETLEWLFRDKSKDFVRQDHVTSILSGGKCYKSFRVQAEQGVSSNKYLQTIVFLWDSREKMINDIKAVLPNAYFM